MTIKRIESLKQHEQPENPLVRSVTTPECLSASLLTLCHNLEEEQVVDMVSELQRQSAAVCGDDLSRLESMLTAQAHTLDGLFAKMASKSVTAGNVELMDRFLRLALRAQNQARATIQTLAEIKQPKQFAFVQQANIGSQVQVNNQQPTRTRKKANAQNELLEQQNGERMDTRATRTAGGTDTQMATLVPKHRTQK